MEIKIRAKYLTQVGDARLFQILFQISFLILGVLWRDFSLKPLQIGLVVASAYLTQWFWFTYFKISYRNYLSAFITSCGVCLLLRSDNLWTQPLAVMVGLSAKFLIRYNDKHIFNPANLAVVFGLFFLPGTWVSPSQWGHEVAIFFWIFSLGCAVSFKAHRLDICFSFLFFWALLLTLKILYLGQIWEHLYHQLLNGSLLVFSFFMISDPMTIPNDRRFRMFYSFIVALFAFVWQFVFYKYNGFIWALFFLSILVPVFDLAGKAPKFQWKPKTVQS